MPCQPFTWWPSHSGNNSNELADVVAKWGTTVEQEEVSHHSYSAKAAIRQATREPLLPTIVYVASTG